MGTIGSLWVHGEKSLASGPNKSADVVGCPLAWLDRNFWMNLIFGGRHLGVVQKPATHLIREDRCKLSKLLVFGPLLQTPSGLHRVGPRQKSAGRCPTKTVATCLQKNLIKFKQSPTNGRELLRDFEASSLAKNKKKKATPAT